MESSAWPRGPYPPSHVQVDITEVLGSLFTESHSTFLNMVVHVATTSQRELTCEVIILSKKIFLKDGW